MLIEKFEDIIAWQKGRQLTKLIYESLKENKDYGFKDQLFRSAVSIMNNIAEGFERRGDKELKYFMFIAKGSCGELRSMLYLANDLGYITDIQYNEFNMLSLEISKLLSGFIKSLS